jgi:hypothetical protein
VLHLFFQGSTDSLRQAGNTRERVKSSVETQDLSDPILFHNGEMYSVTSRQLPISKNNLFCTFHCDTVHTQHFIDDSKQGIESRLDCVAAIYRHIAVQDLLQRFGIGHESLSAGNQLFKQPLCVGFMRVRRANKIHRECWNQPESRTRTGCVSRLDLGEHAIDIADGIFTLRCPADGL